MFKYSIEVDRPLADVYSAFNNQDNLPRWLTGLQRTERISGEPGAIGSKTRQIYLERGRTIELIETITAHEPSKHFAGTIEGGGMDCALEVDFVDRGDSTEIHMRSDFRSKSFMMTLMMPFIKGDIRKRQEGDLATFKKLLEAGELVPSSDS